MFVVGLTGGIGSGKSTVARLFADQGISSVDADELSREVVAPGTPALRQIAEHFGTEILLDSGALDRSQLRHIVFDEPEERKWLENLLHPLIADLIQLGLQQCSSKYCLLVSPLLLETDQHKFVDRILVVDVNEETQIGRTLERDGGNTATTRAIIATQMKRETRLQKADDVLNNEQSPVALREAVELLHDRYLQMAEKANE